MNTDTFTRQLHAEGCLDVEERSIEACGPDGYTVFLGRRHTT